MQNDLLQNLLPLLQTVELGLLVLLVLLGVAIVALFIRRLLVLNKTAGNPEVWALKVARDMSGSAENTGIAGEPDPQEATAPARMFRLGLANAHLCPEALEKVLEAQEIRERKSLEQGVSFLGTVGANAPFLGLTGTVIGILAAFRQMAMQGGSGGPEVMAAISGALIATAAGLIVAIPAVVFYNILKGRIKATLEGVREIRTLLVARSLQATVKEEF